MLIDMTFPGLPGKDVCRGYFSQNATFIPGDTGSYHQDLLSLSYKSRFGTDRPIPLVAEECCMEINRQGEPLSIRADFPLSYRKDRGRHVRQPDQGAGLHGTERVTHSLCNRHPADNIILVPFLDSKIDRATAP